MLAVYNVHNFGLDADTCNPILARIAAEVDVAEANPTRSTIMVLSDLNFHEKAVMYLATPEIDKGLLAEPRSREHGRDWAHALGCMVELDPEEPTHFIAEDQRLTQLDKIY
eukprot:3601816-Pyramimonas_sp.AAC.1